MSEKIFINYRKDDSPWNSLALYQELTKYFPRENIFKDFNTIAPGTDFVESIEKALEECDVLLVLISENWLTITDSKGTKRIEKPDDFVRLEIATALKRNICVIPVLFDDATLPGEEELPDNLKKLSRRQSIEIDKNRFDTDTMRLAEAIKRALPGKPAEPLSKKKGSSSLKVILGIVALIAIAIVAIKMMTGNGKKSSYVQPQPIDTTIKKDSAKKVKPKLPVAPVIVVKQPKTVTTYGSIYGGPSGFQFNDAGNIPNEAKVTGIKINYGSLIDDIAFSWNGFLSKSHGIANKGGMPKTFNLGPSEYITAIRGYAGRDQYQTSDVICKITIITNQRSLGTYGMLRFPNGAPVNDNFSLLAPNSHEIVGIYGRADRFLNAIGILVRER